MLKENDKKNDFSYNNHLHKVTRATRMRAKKMERKGIHKPQIVSVT